MDLPTFRSVFPEFAVAAAVPDALIQFNLNLATSSLAPEVWGDRLDAGIGYYAAHYVALALQRATAVSRGVALGSVGVSTGLTTSKAVDGVSKSMDVSVGQTNGGGTFNLTTYGQTYLTLRNSVAAGVMQF